MSATLSTKEAATMLGRSRQCIRQWCDAGSIECTRDEVTGYYRIPEAAVLERARRTKSIAYRKTHTIPEAAAMLGIPKAEVLELCEARHLSHIKLPNGRILIEGADIARLITKYRRQSYD